MIKRCMKLYACMHVCVYKCFWTNAHAHINETLAYALETDSLLAVAGRNKELEEDRGEYRNCP